MYVSTIVRMDGQMTKCVDRYKDGQVTYYTWTDKQIQDGWIDTWKDRWRIENGWMNR